MSEEGGRVMPDGWSSVTGNKKAVPLGPFESAVRAAARDAMKVRLRSGVLTANPLIVPVVESSTAAADIVTQAIEPMHLPTSGLVHGGNLLDKQTKTHLDSILLRPDNAETNGQTVIEPKRRGLGMPWGKRNPKS